MLFAAFAFSALAAFVKSLSHIHVFEVLFFPLRYYCYSLHDFITPAKNFFYRQQSKIIITAVLFFGMIGMACFFVTLQRMPMGASVSLKYLSPIFTAIFAVLFLSEKVKPIQWLFFFGALAGVFLLKGFDTRIDTVDLFLGITGAVAAGLVYVIIRKIGPSEHPMVIVNYYMLTASIFSWPGHDSFLAKPDIKRMGVIMRHWYFRLFRTSIYDQIISDRRSQQGCTNKIYRSNLFTDYRTDLVWGRI